MRFCGSGNVTFLNADLGNGERISVRIVGSRITALGEAAHAGDQLIDLQGDRMLPGLINAHDHLPLNSLPRLEFRKRYQHVREWIADVDTQRRSDGPLKASVAVPRTERLLLGGVKNLLSGVTTVAHHDPLYPALRAADYPLHVVTDYGWSHSLDIDGDEKVCESFRRTPAEWPWIIHAAEGLGEAASREFDRLEALGCLGANTLIVHGVALDEAQQARLAAAGAGLIWCPASNLALFGTTAGVAGLMRQGRVALGTDSRLSGSRDLLEELRIASGLGEFEPRALESLVTRDAARLLNLADRGVLEAGARADILILPAGAQLARAVRSDVRLVLVDGIARYADKEYGHTLAPPSHWSEVRVDGRPKLLDRSLAARLLVSHASEAGLEIKQVTSEGGMTAVNTGGAPMEDARASCSGGSARPRDTRLKVVLYNPRAVFFTMPLALLAIGSELDPETYEVVIVDGRLEADAEQALLSQLEGALCLGVTVLTGAPISDALQISRAAKRARPDLPVVWGGWHPSMFSRECLIDPCVDVTVRGQGEETFAQIVDRLATGRSLEGCAGCTVRLANGRIHENPPRPLRPVDQFRAHDYGLIPVERYFKLKGKRQLDYISSQGCNFRCAFCSDPFVYGRKWVGLEPTRMVLRLKELWDRYRFDDVNFQDETFFTRRDRIDALASGIVASGMKITWAATMRADQGVRLPDELWARCKQSGLRRLLVGVESGSNEMLKRIAKDIKIEQVFHTAEKMLQYNLAGHFPFIVGFPDEGDASIQASLDVAKRLRSMSPDFLTPIYYFKPYPGSELVIEAVARGYRLPETLEAWAQFDYVAGEPGPWVSPEKFKLIERFKFFHELAWKRMSRGKKVLQQLARYRCRRDEYRWPVEMLFTRWLVPTQKLS